MLESDSAVSDGLANIQSINLDVIEEIEKEIAVYDIVSLVFLLYNNPDVALNRIVMFQRIYKEIGEKNSKLLTTWAQQAQRTPTWRHEFLEALTVCQLYSVIRNLGFQVPVVKRHFQPNSTATALHIHQMKKSLYKLCEYLTTDNLQRLKITLNTYDIDTNEYDTSELVLLHLMTNKFIYFDDKDDGKSCNVEKLIKILSNFPDLKEIANDLRNVQGICNGETDYTESTKNSVQQILKCKKDEKMTPSDFEDMFRSISQLNFDDSDDETVVKNIKSDTKKLDPDAYPIRNSKRIGVCYIINQENFHPSKASIESNYPSSEVLDTRRGSSKDKTVLDETMSSLNFEVISHRDIDHKKMVDCLQNIIEYRVHPDDSIFILCILSHGVKGHVYAADSVLVRVQDLQNIMNDGFEKRGLLEIPKVLILQACQVNDDPGSIVADAPSIFHIRKSHFLIYWATAPELEAFREENKGSIFIQVLCYILKKKAKHEHLYDIFTKVTDSVAHICTRLQKDQIPLFESTLRKKLYLQIPQ